MIWLFRLLKPSTYSTRLFVRTIIELCLLALLIEGLYLSERFISILKIVIDKPVGIENIAPLLASAAPEVHLALPLAVLIATYRVVLLSREHREFVALASGGQSSLPLLWCASALALVALMISLLTSGELAPRAKFVFRAYVDSIQYEALRGGSTPGQFLYFPNHTIYIWPTEHNPARPIFVKQIRDERSNRILNAQNTEIVDRSAQGMLIIGMYGVTINDFPNYGEKWAATDLDTRKASDPICESCAPQLNHFHSDSLVKTVDILQLVPAPPRGASIDEWTTPELFGWAAAPGIKSLGTAETSEVTRRLARALLCFLAPFVAWLTLTFTTRRSQAFALPVACIGIMVADVGFSQLVGRLGQLGAGALSSILVCIACIILILLVAQTIVRQHQLIFPALGRS
jgi:lipopolysaccharide export LptBFGC system permease protein LptF